MCAAALSVLGGRAVVFFVWLAPAVGRDFSWAVVAVAALLFAASLAFLLATALSDPGFVPRDPPDEAEMGCAPVPLAVKCAGRLSCVTCAPALTRENIACWLPLSNTARRRLVRQRCGALAVGPTGRACGGAGRPRAPSARAGRAGAARVAASRLRAFMRPAGARFAERAGGVAQAARADQGVPGERLHGQHQVVHHLPPLPAAALQPLRGVRQLRAQVRPPLPLGGPVHRRGARPPAPPARPAAASARL